MTDKEGKKSKVKVLVGTDVTDNYVMIVGTEEAKYAANTKIIDEIWGSFEMWSGGSSGNN
jgi:general stress protein 26